MNFKLDAVVISHNHSGHMDVATLKRLVDQFGPDRLPIFCPKGLADTIRGPDIGAKVVIEMGKFYWSKVQVFLLFFTRTDDPVDLEFNTLSFSLSNIYKIKKYKVIKNNNYI